MFWAIAFDLVFFIIYIKPVLRKILYIKCKSIFLKFFIYILLHARIIAVNGARENKPNGYLPAQSQRHMHRIKAQNMLKDNITDIVLVSLLPTRIHPSSTPNTSAPIAQFK